MTSPFGQGLLALGLGSVVLLGCLRAWGWWRLGAASSLVELAVGVAGFLVNLFATFS